MKTIGDYEDDEDGYLDESVEWIARGRLAEVAEPGYFTVGQCALLIPAVRHATKGMDTTSINEAAAAYLMLAQRDIAHQELEARHPQTLLPYSEYLRMAESGMYGDGARDMPMLNMGWLVAIDEAERWYEAKGFKVDLAKVRADMEAFQARGTRAADDSNGEIEPWIELAHEYARDIWLSMLHNNNKPTKEKAAIEIAGRLKRTGKVTKMGKTITPGNVLRWALRQWKPPEIRE